MRPETGLNQDFIDLLQALVEHQVRFLLVGAHAMAVHGVPRSTGDMDVLYEAEPQNVEYLLQALRSFGAPVEAHGVTEASLLEPRTVYQIGLPPRRIDLINHIDGVSFEDAWVSKIDVDLDQLKVPVIGVDALRKNKASTGRHKDLLDVELLDRIHNSEN